jgi:SAM-dependent methyltransferase
MEHTTTSNVYDVLRPLMSRLGVTASAPEFHDAVNVAFHEFESECYDEIHRSMWESLPTQFGLVSDDVFEVAQGLGDDLVMLDVGCGTGLATELLLRTPLGKKVRRVDLVDTSPAMLKAAAARAAHWGVEQTLTLGTSDEAPADNYGIILICSVLHHVPDLPALFDQLGRLQTRGGLFLHFQDPNGDYLHDPALLQRIKACGRTPRMLGERVIRRLSSTRIGRRLQGFLPAGAPRRYIDKTNDALLAAGVIRRPMTAGEVWSVTDLHVVSGISMKKMRDQLASYEPISMRSYAFFGRMRSELPTSLQVEERRLSTIHSKNGMQVAGAWQHT